MNLSLQRQQPWSVWGMENLFYGSCTALGADFLAVKYFLTAWRRWQGDGSELGQCVWCGKGEGLTYLRKVKRKDEMLDLGWKDRKR